MGKMTSNRARAQRASETPRAATSTETPPDYLEGDALLRWLRENRSAFLPTDHQLASVRLTGEDCVARRPWLFAVGYDELTLNADVETVRAHFHKADPCAVFSDDGARLNGLHRELAARHSLPNARWGMGATLASIVHAV